MMLSDYGMLEHRAYVVPELNDNNYAILEDALARLPGVHSPGLDTPKKTLRVSFSSHVIAEQEILKAVAKAGFSARLMP